MTALRSTFRDLLWTAALGAAGITTGLVLAIVYLTVRFLAVGS